MATLLNPILTATPGNPLTYNVGMAETFSWIPVENDADRPIYARATYLTNVDDIKIQLSASNINVSLDDLELNTDNIEELIDSTNFTLSAFRLETKEGVDRANTLLEVLTGTQDQSVSLLNALTANTDEIEGLVIANNTLLDSLTALTQNEFDQTQTLLDSLTAIQVNKQDHVITLLNQLTANTNEVEGLVTTNNTLLDSLTALTQSEFNQTQSFLSVLTAVDYATSSKQDQVITLLDALTAKETTISLDVSAINVNTDEIEGLIKTSNTFLNTLTSSNQQIQANSSSAVTLLNDLTSSNVHVAGFNIPPYDEINLEYEGATEYLRKTVYLNNSTQVLALSFVYVTEPPTTSDNRILKVKKL